MKLYGYRAVIDGIWRVIFTAHKTDPSKQKRYPEQSARQARRKYRTVTINGFQIMQRLPRHLQGAVQ